MRRQGKSVRTATLYVSFRPTSSSVRSASSPGHVSEAGSHSSEQYCGPVAGPSQPNVSPQVAHTMIPLVTSSSFWSWLCTSLVDRTRLALPTRCKP